jgi:hypothetical protein
MFITQILIFIILGLILFTLASGSVNLFVRKD